MALEFIPTQIKDLATKLVSRADRRRGMPALIELEHGTDNPMLDRKFEFQYWPSEIQISKAINYASKDIIGGNAPLQSWSGGGELLISFSTYFTCDMDLLASTPQGAVPSELELDQRLQDLANAGEGHRNRDLRDVMAYFARFQLGSYDEPALTGGVVTAPPRKVLLILPNMNLARIFGQDSFSGQGADALICFIKQADPTIQSAFSSNLPRIISYSFSFAHSAQAGGEVRFPRYTKEQDAKIALRGRWRPLKGV